MRKILLGAVSVLALGSGCLASTQWGAPGFSLVLSNTSPNYSLSFAEAPDPNEIVVSDGSWSSQDGALQGTFATDADDNGYSLSYNPTAFVNYSTFSATAAAGEQPITITGSIPSTAPGGPQTVTWQLNADWSAINPSQLATAQMVFPAPGQVIDNSTPTLSWSYPAGKETGSDGIIWVINSSNQVVATAPVGSSTSWAVPAALPSGSYTVRLLNQDSNFAVVPITTSLIDGTDQVLPTEATVSYQSVDNTSFTIDAPEPAFGALGALSLLFVRRRQARG